jgi:hypothetical protein
MLVPDFDSTPGHFASNEYTRTHPRWRNLDDLE